jgi:hypothetical protein
MIVEVTFWIAVVIATRKLGKVYAKSGDVLYGSYIAIISLDDYPK